MPQPIWRELTRVRVPERKEGIARQWTMAQELIAAGKTVKLEVVVDPQVAQSGTWLPRGFTERCTADGDFRLKVDGKGLLPTAPLGALIGRIGGSATDQPEFTDKGTNPASVVVFSVGRACVMTVPATPVGSLYLGANVAPTQMADIEGELVVSVSEAL